MDNIPDTSTTSMAYDTYEEMVTREDVKALIDSVEILSNPKTMEALHKSDQDIEAGCVKEVTSVKKLLDEL